ncbi:ROK family protein [Listeria grandensis FSL F6-0971]|uniref:ROK family protein n=1 Tax=Listeria grandensis FSL F6-0971 TaxID=1265819 RepID=W7B6K8_9LIST|nr:ROK family protein [Listeria grandensis]EUJ18476.1 ROK family protein [Listeria grandensis FSL F6-0971]
MVSNMLETFRTTQSSKIKKLKILYNLIRKHASITVEELLAATGMKPATCARLLDELSKNDLITSNELGVSTGGRKPILYRINPEKAYLIGIEVTNIYSTIVLTDLNLKELGHKKIQMRKQVSMYETLDMFTAQLLDLLAEQGKAIADILGIGISIDDALDQISENSDVTPHDIEHYLASKIPTYITVGSGVNFAALAEYRLHYWQTSERFLLTTVDVEIRSAEIVGGIVASGQSRMTNAFGHTIIDTNGSRCYCGSYGCLHTYSSLSAIKAKIGHELKQGKPSILSELVTNPDDIDYFTIFQALEKGDPMCHDTLKNAAYYYGIALSNLILMTQPDTVVCGGTLVPKGTFFEDVKRITEERLKAFPKIKTTIYPAKESYEIVAQGAGGMVLEQFLR